MRTSDLGQCLPVRGHFFSWEVRGYLEMSMDSLDCAVLGAEARDQENCLATLQGAPALCSKCPGSRWQPCRVEEPFSRASVLGQRGKQRGGKDLE